jgi:SecD/SecF fusion protein
MQNKGLIRLFAIVFGLVCIYQLSFTYFTNKTETAAKEFAISKAGDNADERDINERVYLDSVGKLPIFAGITYNEAKEKELNKGLDLKGGINVILQISVRDILGGLANGKRHPKFITALDAADEAQKDSQNPYFEDFLTAFEAEGGDVKLADPDLFSNVILGEKIDPNMTNDEAAAVLRDEIKETIQSAFETLRNRIDKFGVTQPNIQSLGDNGRILVELPGAKDIKRAVTFLSAKAQLEFYETHYAGDVINYLGLVDQTLAATVKKDEKEETEVVQDSTDNVDSVVDDLLKDAEGEDEEAVAQNNPLLEIFSPNSTAFQYREVPTVGYAAVKDTATINGYLRTPAIVRLRPANLRFAKFAWGDLETVTIGDGEETTERVALYALESNRSGEPYLSGDGVNDARQPYTVTHLPAVGLDFAGQGINQWA